MQNKSLMITLLLKRKEIGFIIAFIETIVLIISLIKSGLKS